MMRLSRATVRVVLLSSVAFLVQGGELQGPCAGCTAVYYSGLNNSKCFRIPTIIRTHLGTLLAFAENRVSNCGDDGANHDLVVRRSHDLGNSWGPLITVKHGVAPCVGCPAAISNPNPVEVKHPDGTYKVLLHYDTMNNPSPSKHGLDMQIWSNDDGETWENATELSFPPIVNDGGMIGPSVGLQGASGTIYFSARQVGGISPGGNFMYWSKDLGRTWIPSQQISSISSETSIAWLHNSSDERIIMSIRTGNHRSQVIFDRDGIPGNVTQPAGLIDPNCQGSLINVDGTLYLSNANTTSGRTHMAVKSSVDQGTTWSSGVSVWTGPSAYSQLVGLDKGSKLGLLFEAGDKSAYETISWVVVDAAESSKVADLEIIV